MRKINKTLAVLGLGFVALPALAGCSSSSEGKTILRVLNMEDYIYVQDIDDGYEAEDLTTQFEQYIADTPELAAKYGEVEVIYDTTDTNETLYSEMQTGKALYDLICPSDYMIQKLVASDMLVKLDKDQVPNYFGTYNEETKEYEGSKALPVIKDLFDNIPCAIIGQGEDGKSTLSEYAVGYMWGTLGILFNPEYKTFVKNGYEKEEVIQDMSTWHTLWDSKYKNTISVKDSMRDTYAVGVLETYQEEISQLKADYDDASEKYEAGEISEEEYLRRYNDYREEMTEIFNRCEEVNVKEVEKTLNLLKGNYFGLEVDSGKEDIVTGKIGINLAWSGDAVYSMDQAEDEEKVGENIQELCYAIPDNGSNLWFDAWVMPKLKEGDRSENQFDLAHEFLNFLCEPTNVAQNMDYIGYTSFMGGDDTLALVNSWFDIRYDDLYFVDEEENEYSVYVQVISEDEANPEETVEDYYMLKPSDMTLEGHNDLYDDCELYYQVEDGEEFIYEPVLNEDESVKTYGDVTIVNDPEFMEEEGIQEVDLRHYFAGTLDEYSDEDAIFYSDCYYCEINEDGDLSTAVGRQFYCQYPDKKTLDRCFIMRDYGANNQYVMKMWERFKSNSLPTWAIILFVVEIVGAAALISYFIINKRIKKSLRKKRKEELAKK